MKIFSNFDIYNTGFTYDEMKVMNVLSRQQGIDCFDYEDLMRICRAVYDHWVDGRDTSEDEKYKMYPWLEFETSEEDGYIQKYADRILPNLIKLYKEYSKVERLTEKWYHDCLSNGITVSPSDIKDIVTELCELGG